ncbi:hypothetical protein R1flu_002082 [Riccia fluitans]|uniref:Uncharacterized protein n=1 Tax=Riccia fluitans TaxID=41844 RepID=A0ABD1Y823_9MARC
MKCRGRDRGKQPMVSDNGNRRGEVFEEVKYHPIAIVVVVEATGAIGQSEGQKKKRKRNQDCHKVGLVCLRVTINVVIRPAWMKWFVLNLEEKKNYLDYYTLGTNKGVSCFCKQLYKLGTRAYKEH